MNFVYLGTWLRNQHNTAWGLFWNFSLGRVFFISCRLTENIACKSRETTQELS